MNITVNGNSEETSANNIAELLSSKKLTSEDYKGVIVEHNYTIVKTHKWTSTEICEGDNIEILKLTGGG